ncbi:MAG: bifunctional phosphoribosylaminoimidazolecarboxamide formyltransferase/IMP cyclohydrolase PurH [Cyanobacteria bacterium J083]|nr:MAG: bifunctional phosphoribosylaminoimidazolecarboxamide formyltransferase/IMP cyclohydrolase PurH [Cyanobacteria bacterium J083]
MGKIALLSVSDKTGIVDLASKLVKKFNFQIISSGGTAKTLQAAGIEVTKISDYTGSAEILGGRVKTLHPRVHGGILARRNVPEDLKDLEDNNIQPIDLVVVNLYPFEQTIAQANCTLEAAIENIDIGGPTLLRAAAKNYAHVTVLCEPGQYDKYLAELSKSQGEPSWQFRQAMAELAFNHTCAYDAAIANYFASLHSSETNQFPPIYHLTGKLVQTLRYGENPHQPAAWYQTGKIATGWTAAEKLQGKELSYNNLVDLEAARRIIAEFPSTEPTAAILKHTNPCGAAIGNSLAEAYQKAFAADSISAFGGIVALNQTIDQPTAQALTKTFLECVVAPDCTPEARTILRSKSKLRILLLPNLITGPKQTIKAIAGGLLIQNSDDLLENPEHWEIVTKKQPTPEDMAEMLFAWKLVKHIKSNAILVTSHRTTVGVGAGQMNRVGAVKIALEQAGDKAKGGVLASDGFFPFDDSVRTAAAAGVKAIVQPGGSIRDKDSIQAADELGLIMVFTKIRHFLH